MTPYAQPPPHPPPHKPTGGGSIVILFVLIGLGAVLSLGGVLAWLVFRGLAGAHVATVPSGSSASGTALPPVTRRVPKHGLSILDGCGEDDLRALVQGIDGAISVGAPLYNSGNFAGCYHLYEGTAADLERRLPARCAGPVRALDAGRARAASLDDPSGQAWAMRDAFDGLLDVVERRGSSR